MEIFTSTETIVQGTDRDRDYIQGRRLHKTMGFYILKVFGRLTVSSSAWVTLWLFMSFKSIKKNHNKLITM